MTTSGQLLGLAAVTAFLCLGVYVQNVWRRWRRARFFRQLERVSQSNCRKVWP